MEYTDSLKLIKEKAASMGYVLTDEQAVLILKYYEKLAETNKVMNLTRIVDFEDAVEKHFVDSFTGADLVDVKNISSVIDIGSGAGFPGIPLKILYPHISLIMVDSVGKKMNFVNRAVSEIGIEGATALHARAEELARDKKYRERFDLCVSRAVANLSTLSEYTLPFVKEGGVFIAYKAEDSEDEIKNAEKALHILGGELEQVKTFSLFGMGRALVKVRKVKKTGMQYPRKAGVPSRSPL